MTREEISKIVKECPYADKSIDNMHTCDLEFHYRKICPSPKCICAKRFGLFQQEREGGEVGTTREEAINKLHGLIYGVVDRQRIDDTCREVIDYLEAQEPRVMTAADFDNNPNTDSKGFLPAWIEYRRDGEWGEYCADDDDEWASVKADNFEGYGYRCWTSRPTDEVMEATPWE